MTRTKCNESIKKELKNRIEDFSKAIKGEWNEGEEYEDFIEWLNSYCLEYSDDIKYRGKRLLMSWGGPEDFFIFHENGDITYHYLDWFDGAERNLEGNDYRIMRKVFEEYLNV